MSYRAFTLVLAGVLVATCASARATAIVFDANSSLGLTADPTWSHTIGAGSDRILIVGVIYEGGDPTITSIKYGDANLTLAISGSISSGGTKQTASLYYLLNPATGTANIAIDHLSGTTNSSAGGISLANVAQQAPEVTVFDSETSASPLTISTDITTLTDGAWVVDVVGNGGNTNDHTTAVVGMVERWDEKASSSGGAGSTREVATAGTITNTWDLDLQGNRLTHALAAFAPVPEPATMALLAVGGVAILVRRRRS